jgi:signal transduction histidine kinase
MVEENAVGLQHVLENLEQLSRTEVDARQRRNVLLPHAAREAVRQLRDAAAVRGVRVTVAADLPNVEVDAATVELCLANYVSNGIKYSDPSREERRVHVEGVLTFGPRPEDGELRVMVRDNGLGVPEAARERLFSQFYRAHETITGVEGTGLGLSIVRETVEALGGRVWADFPEQGGAVFGFALPSRREEDAAAAGLPRGELPV